MKRILSKILLICAVCISLLAGNAQIANAETAVPYYTCANGVNYTLAKAVNPSCDFIPLESYLKVSFDFSNKDLFNDATLDIKPTNFSCDSTRVIVKNGTNKKFECERSNTGMVKINVGLNATLNQAESVEVKMSEVVAAAAKLRK